MENREIVQILTRLAAKLDNIDQGLRKDVGKIKVTLGKQEIHLKNHIRRTEIIEKAFQPIQKKVHMLEGVGKFLGASLVSGLIIWAIVSFV